ncbi:MAG: Intracellular distribution of mitochondria [Pycnora praestabilis]|nr:MAG: Intracellular distribution of mitochondria [Pycnora praestabilis]
MAVQQDHDAKIGVAQAADGVLNHETSAAKETDADHKQEGEQAGPSVFQLTVFLPHEPHETQIMVSPQEQVSEVRQYIVEFPNTFQYSCFHLEHNGQRINDFVELSDIDSISSEPALTLVEDPYTEKEARIHLVRIRELIGAAGDRIDTLHGVLAGLSLHDTVVDANSNDLLTESKPTKETTPSNSHAMTDYIFASPGSLCTLLPRVQDAAPKTIKSVSVSPWNPPPYHLRQKGHLLYLQVTTNEGEQYQITSHVSGFYVNKSSNSKFDPAPRLPPRNLAAHSLFSLIELLSPSFSTSFTALQEYINKKDPLATYQIASAIPSSPWIVPSPASSLLNHQPDITRTQESYLIAGVENSETLRDWNEELQSMQELPRETVQDRVLRERITSKTYGDYNDAAARGAVLVAKGEVAPLNPTESRDAQIFVYNNIFFSFGADGVGTFATEGGDEAARVATGKDVMGVRAVNQLDIQGLFTPGTVVVDFIGKRLVGQSIVPGIFKQRDPGEHQIDYGGVEGKDIIAENEAFVPVFKQLSTALRIKKHAVWDKEGKRHELEGSVETKGLLGTDGRKYVLNLYRITPLDVVWLEQHWSGPTEAEQNEAKKKSYPHRMAVLRPELVNAYWNLKMRDFVKGEINRRRLAPKETNRETVNEQGESNKVETDRDGSDTEGVSKKTVDDSNSFESEQERIDVSGFLLALNPDVHSGQVPQSNEEKDEWARDEKEIHQLKEGDVGFPMDGQSLSHLLHKRGINIRYLGQVATLAAEQGPRLQALRALTVQEMVARAFKHIANRYLRYLPLPFAGACVAHLLNCLLGTGLNQSPVAEIEESLMTLYPEANLKFGSLDPVGLRRDIRAQVNLRYNYDLDDQWVEQLKHVQMLREISLKLGLQLEAKDFRFAEKLANKGESEAVDSKGAPKRSTLNGSASSSSKKKKNSADAGSPASLVASEPPSSAVTFLPDDVINFVPIVKDASPRSTLAEEALEAGRISIVQDQKELGKDLLLESLSLHEQIYGLLHPEVARVYHQVAMLYYQLEDKPAAVELARKAVIIFERTVGVDSAETVLSYLNLGLFEHAVGNTKSALAYIRHALELWKIIYGINHPDSITTINNAAVMLQHLKYYHESRLWFEASLLISEEIYGKHSVHAATLLFQLAQALALDQDSKGAVNRMREAYNIFLNELGASDRNTKEADNWLEQLTQNAVSIAKHAKDIQARRLRRANFTPRVTLGTRPQPQVGQSSSDAAHGNDARNSIGLDSRSVDELMKFIEGGGDTLTRSTPKKRPGRSNPKRRGGSVVGTAA